MSDIAHAPPSGRTVAERLASLILDERPEIDQATAEYAKLLCLGCLGSAIAGTRFPAGRILLEHAADTAMSGPATLYLSGRRSSLETASLVNSTLWHATEMEGNTYPEVVSIYTVVPPLLAVAEWVAASGDALLEAAVLSHELQGRLSLAANQNPNSPTSFHYMNMHVMGGVAVAAGAARLMALPALETATAISIAASQAAGLVRQTGSMTHYVESGFTARAGVTAALLAARGLTANLEIIEVTGGLLDVAGATPGSSLEAIFSDWATPYRLTEHGDKLYPCCYLMQHLMQAVRSAKRTHGFSAAEVSSVEVDTNQTHSGICRFTAPATAEQAQFSMPHGIAVALQDDDLALEHFIGDGAQAAAVAVLRERVSITVHEDWEDGTLAQPHRVVIRLSDGRRLGVDAPAPHGHPPDYLDRSEFVAKYRRCAVPVVGDRRADEIEAAVLELEQLDQVAELADALRPAP